MKYFLIIFLFFCNCSLNKDSFGQTIWCLEKKSKKITFQYLKSQIYIMKMTLEEYKDLYR